MKRKIKAGSTSHMEPIRVYDSSSTTGAYLGSIVYNTSGLTGKYRREGSSAWTPMTLANATAGTFTSEGWAVPTSGPTGSYEVHIPNAAIAAGAKWVEIEYWGVTNMHPVQLFYELDAVDYQTANFGSTAQTGDCYPPVSDGTYGNAALKTSLDNLGTSVAGLDTKLGTPSVSVSADIATRLATAGYTAPPSVAAIADQITSDHGSGSYITATGFLTSLGSNAPAGWINAAALADAAITAAKLADNAITAAKLADNTITAAKIAANALAAAKFAADAIAAIQSGLALQASVDTLETEVGKVIKSGEEFTADNGTDTKDVTFTRI